MKGRVTSLLRMQPPIITNRGLLFASGATVPTDDTDGYQTGCIFQHTDGGNNTALYVNEGSVAACDFNPIEGAAKGETAAIEFALTSSSPLISTPDAYTGAFICTGTYASAHSMGITLSATNQRPVTLLSDAGGVVLGAGNYRAFLSRVYLDKSQTGQIAIRAIRGQLKLADQADLNIGTNEMNAINGVEGYIELAGLSTIGANTRVAAVHGLVEVTDDITLTSGGKLVGLYAELSQVTAKTVSGIGTCGILVDRLDPDHTTHQAAWTSGLIIAASSCVTGIGIGACTDGITVTGATRYAVDIQTSGVIRMGVQGTGIPVTSTYPFAVEVHNEANADIVAGDTGSSAGIYSRYEVQAAQTSQCNHISVFAKLRPKAAMADGVHCGVYGLVEASETMEISGTATTLTCAAHFALDFGSNVRVSAGHVNGICVDSSVASDANFTGATFAGIRLKRSGTSKVWTSGITVEDGCSTTGLTIGNCTTQGILLDGTASSAQLKIAGTAILASGEQAIYINCPLETVATNGIWITLKSTVTTGDCAGIRSRLTTTGASGDGNNRSVWAQSYIGASGYADVVDGVLAEVSVAAGSANTQHVACLRAHFSAGASFVNDVSFYVIHARCQTRSDETFSGNNALLGLENQAVGGNGKKLNAVIEAKYTSLGGGVHAADYLIDCGTAVNLIDTAVFRFPDDGAVCEASAAGTGDADGADFVGYIKVVIGTTTMYIPLLAGTPAAIFT